MVPVEFHKHLLIGFLVQLTPLLQGFVVQHPYLVACALEHHRLLGSISEDTRRRTLSLRPLPGHSGFEQSSDEVAERIVVRTYIHLALLTCWHTTSVGENMLAVSAHVSETFCDILRRLSGSNSLPTDSALMSSSSLTCPSFNISRKGLSGSPDS